MADGIVFNEGKTYLANNGLPSTCYFLLSTHSVDATSPHAASDTLVGGVAEITGTGYARQTESEPTAVSGLVTFAQKSWATGSATNWPAICRSVVLVTTADSTGKALCAWNLVAGGTARDMSAANTTENFTPTLQVG
jgi:hypothetical protein